MPIDLARARSQTPGCGHVLHLDNAGAGLMPEPVIEAVRRHLTLEAEIGGYAAETREAGRIAAVYDSIARLLNAEPGEIALIENATRAWDMAFYALSFEPGDRILTAMAEYASNYIAFLQVARRTGAVVEPVPNDETGALSLAALEAMIDDRVKLIAITHVPTNGGLINPAAGIGRIARAARIPFLLDACQSVGQMPIDVAAIGCDMLSATGRKFLRGPRGTGFLYVRRGMIGRLEPPFLDLHAASWVARDRYQIRADARRFETWESYVAGRLGLGAAVDYALEWGLEAIRARAFGLAEGLREGLAAIPGVTVADLGREKCAIVTFAVEGRPADAVARALAAQAINVSTSTVRSTRLEMAARGIDALVRASPHYYTSEEEIERFTAAVGEIAQGRRVAR